VPARIHVVTLELTVAILLGALAIAALANWRERRPRELGRPPLVPSTAIQAIAIVVVILMLAHLVSLLTGQPLKGRGSP
jgi:hypothetical protein